MEMVDAKGMRILIIFWVLKALSGLFSSGVTIGLCHGGFLWQIELSLKNGRETRTNYRGGLIRGDCLN